MSNLKMRVAALAAALAFVCLTCVAQTGVTVAVAGDPITIDSGKLAGTMLDSGVKAYFGIPFAEPPVRELRWQEPHRVKAWKGTYHADRMMPECVQPLRAHNINHYFGEEPTSEDCLYMNIWAPGSAKAGDKLPVIVFVYGGGFTIGSSGIAQYGGENVARKGAIFVNFNYRIGLLGFMAHPELTSESPHHASGDYGLLDQVAALEWIQTNIAKFGGDPSRVAISGQSAGAGSVSALQASPLAKGLFRGILAMSGSEWGGNSMTTLAEAEKTGLQVQDALKAKSMDDLRQIPADKIVALQEDCQLGCGSGTIRSSGPIVDGYFLPESPQEIFAAHKQSDVPVIVEFTHDESTNALRNAKNLQEYLAAAKQIYGANADEFLKLYPATTDAEAQEMGRAAARESIIEKTQRNWAIAQVKCGSAPVYVSMFTRIQPFTPGVVIADNPQAIGAYHTSDVPYWFGTQDSLNMFRTTRNWTPYDRDLSAKMTEVLIAFAKTGAPQTAAIQWPQWKPQQEQLLEWGDKISVLPMNTARLDFAAQHGGGRGPSGPPPGRSSRD
jgi:para-nitrobenzyl esterase